MRIPARALAVLVVACFATPAFGWPAPRKPSPTTPAEPEQQPGPPAQPPPAQPVDEDQPDEPMPEPDEPMPEPDPPAQPPTPPAPPEAVVEPPVEPPVVTAPVEPLPPPAPTAPRFRRVSLEGAVVIAVPTGVDMKDELDTKASTGLRLTFGLDLVRWLRLYLAVRWVFVATGDRFQNQNLDVGYRDLGIGVRYQHQITPEIHLFGELELTSGSLSVEFSDPMGPSGQERWSGTGGAGRVGAGYRLTPGFSLLAAAGYSRNDIAVEEFELEVQWWSFDVTAQLRF